MLMMLPLPRLIIPAATALPTMKAEVTLVAISCSNLSVGNWSSGARCCIPALLTRMSIGPISLSACSTASVTLSSFVTSKARARTRTLASASLAAASPNATLSRALRMTSAPAPASAAAIAKPMPRLEPVTRARRPARLNIDSGSKGILLFARGTLGEAGGLDKGPRTGQNAAPRKTFSRRGFAYVVCRYRPDRAGCNGFQPRPEHRRERLHDRSPQPNRCQDRRICRGGQGAGARRQDHPKSRPRRVHPDDQTAALGDHHGQGRQARRRYDRAAPAPSGAGR